MDYKKHPERKIRHWISWPIIWSVLLPLVITDIWIEVYHRTCFVLCGLPYIKRKDYIRIDRHKLNYLGLVDKTACAYCGYANGLVGYWVAIAGATEKYWCGIKHKKYAGFHEPQHQKNFLAYGDKESFDKL